jgi:hypothetical protein
MTGTGGGWEDLLEALGSSDGLDGLEILGSV